MKESATRLADIMTRAVASIDPDSTLQAAQEQMRAAGIHHLVVMKAGRVAGVLSLRDVERARAARYASGDDEWTVEDVMSARVVVAAPDTTVREAANLLRGHAIGCLPVVDGKQLVGIVTTADLLDLLAHAKIAGPRSDAKRRGESIERAGSAGPRSDAKRRGESIDQEELDEETRVAH